MRRATINAIIITGVQTIYRRKVYSKGFRFHKKYLQNNAVHENASTIKISGKHIFFVKTGYFTSLGVPILINCSTLSTLE